MIIISNDGKKYKVRKYIISSDGEESIWCDDWYGRHVIGQDCNWEALTGDRDCEELKEALKLCQPYMEDLQMDNHSEESVGIRYDYDLERAMVAMYKALGIETHKTNNL